MIGFLSIYHFASFMQCYPALQSWCVVPRSNRMDKFTKAHEFLQRNPSVLDRLLKTLKKHPSKPTSFSVVIEKTDELTPAVLIDILEKWDLNDVLDLQIHETEYTVVFRTAISAHAASKLAEFNARCITNIPKTARAPVVYIQGIPSGTSFDEIAAFFQTISPILSIKCVERSDMHVHILKFASERKALRVAETADGERFGTNTMIVSHQYKSTVTSAFFVTTTTPGVLTIDAVGTEVAKIGQIAAIFKNEMGSMGEIFVLMESICDASIACGMMNKRSYAGELVHACFVDPMYFNEVREANDV